MIQRIQTLYLLMVFVVTGLMFLFPLGTFLGDTNEYELTLCGLRSISEPGQSMVVSTIYMGILAALAALLPLVTIFLFKKRFLQIRLCFAEVVLQLGLLVFAGYYLYHASGGMEVFSHTSAKYSIVALMPIAGIVFTVLALRGIMKDERLIRSLNRIR